MKYFSKLLQRLGLNKSGRSASSQPTVTASSAVPPLSPEPLHEPIQVVILEAIAETTITEAIAETTITEAIAETTITEAIAETTITEAIAETTITEAVPASPFPATEAPEPIPETGSVDADEQEPPVPEILVHAPARSLESLLKDIEEYASWDAPTGPEQLKTIVSECRACYPDQEDAIQKRIQRGEEIRNWLKPFFKIGSMYGKSSKEAKQELGKLEQVRPDLLGHAKHTLQKGDSARQRWQESNQRKKSAKPVSK